MGVLNVYELDPSVDRGEFSNSPYENSYSNITGGLSSWLNSDYMYILTRPLNPLSGENLKKMVGFVEPIMKSILNDSGLRDMDISSFCNSLRYSHFPKIITLIGQEAECRFDAGDTFNVSGIITASRQNIAKCFESGDDTISILTRSMTEKCFGGHDIEEQCLTSRLENITSISSFSDKENCVQSALNSLALQCLNVTGGYSDPSNKDFKKMFYGCHGITSTLVGLSNSICAETFSNLWDQLKELNAPKLGTQSFNDTITDEESIHQFEYVVPCLIAGAIIVVIAAKYGGLMCAKAKDALLDCISYAGYGEANTEELGAGQYPNQAGIGIPEVYINT